MVALYYLALKDSLPRMQSVDGWNCFHLAIFLQMVHLDSERPLADCLPLLKGLPMVRCPCIASISRQSLAEESVLCWQTLLV